MYTRCNLQHLTWIVSAHLHSDPQYYSQEDLEGQDHKQLVGKQQDQVGTIAT